MCFFLGGGKDGMVDEWWKCGQASSVYMCVCVVDIAMSCVVTPTSLIDRQVV